MQKYCLNIETFLKYDIHGSDLSSELKVLKKVLNMEENTPIDTLNYIKMLDSFPNACIAYKILLTIPVTVAFLEWSFLKLKLIISKINYFTKKIKWISYIIDWKSEMLQELEYKKLINNFASQKAKRINF